MRWESSSTATEPETKKRIRRFSGDIASCIARTRSSSSARAGRTSTIVPSVSRAWAASAPRSMVMRSPSARRGAVRPGPPGRVLSGPARRTTPDSRSEAPRRGRGSRPRPPERRRFPAAAVSVGWGRFTDGDRWDEEELMTADGAAPEEEEVRVEQRGLYYEELQTGAVYVHRPGRTVTDADNVLFSTLTMNPQSLHLDAHFSAATEFGRPLVNSLFTLSTLVGLSVNQLTQATTVANLGFGEVSFPHPVFAGDTLYAETRVLDKRLSRSRPDNGVVRFEHRARNQDGVLVARVERSALMLRLPEERR